jgi:mannose-6-phosphate isomerase-like protein (cupin superfamily)
MKLDVRHPVLLGPGEGEIMADEPAKTLRLLADFDELALTWFRYAAGERGPELHIHERHTDAFFVLTGELSVALGPNGAHDVRGRAGALFAAPAGLAHTFANESTEDVTFLNIHAPNMGFADMLRARRDGRDEDAERFDQIPPPPGGGRPVSDATVSLPGEVEPIPGAHRTLVAKAERGEFEFAEFDASPEYGPVPPHVHDDHTDSFYVLEGEVEFTIGDEIVRGGPGTFFAAPPGVRHGFDIPGPGRTRFLNIHAPGIGFFQGVRQQSASKDN